MESLHVKVNGAYGGKKSIHSPLRIRLAKAECMSYGEKQKKNSSGSIKNSRKNRCFHSCLQRSKDVTALPSRLKLYHYAELNRANTSARLPRTKVSLPMCRINPFLTLRKYPSNTISNIRKPC